MSLDLEAAAPRLLPRKIDSCAAPLWAAGGVLAAAGGAPLGALMVGEGADAGRLALGGALGALAVGGTRCLLDLALPPPGDCPRVARNAVFGVAALTLGPVLGTMALTGATGMKSVEPLLAAGAGVVGALWVGAGAVVVAMPILVCRAMFVDDCF